MLNNTVNEKNLTPGGCLPLSRGSIHVYNNYYQTSSALKPLGQCRVEPPWEVGEKVYIIGTSHLTKMAAMLIYDKNLLKSNRPRYQVSVYRTIGPLVTILAWRTSWLCNLDHLFTLLFPFLWMFYMKLALIGHAVKETRSVKMIDRQKPDGRRILGILNIYAMH